MRVNYYPTTNPNSFHLQMLPQLSNFNHATFSAAKHTKVKTFFFIIFILKLTADLSLMKKTLSSLCVYYAE